MKGLLFHKQLEIRVDVEGEEFRQGDTIPCTLTIKNRGATAVDVGVPVLALAKGDLKKVKQKAPDAFSMLARADAAVPGSVAPDQQCTTSTRFQLEQNCHVTNKQSSLCILYGVEGDDAAQAHLQLPVLPHADIESIVGVVETSFQFVLKSWKSKSGWVSAKLKAPDEQRMTTIDELDLGFRFVDELLELDYTFKVKKLEAGPSTLEIQKKKQTFRQSLRRDEYLAPGGYVDSGLLEPKIEEILAQVSSKFAR
ncbi:MAG: hypothetical protein KDD69_16550 [Bdellovibrionales bacterium]|nr:hypothetical protein [Bdellovibrionales bacterium]